MELIKPLSCFNCCKNMCIHNSFNYIVIFVIGLRVSNFANCFSWKLFSVVLTDGNIFKTQKKTLKVI